MPDFQRAKVYSIRSHQTDKIYIGSTTQTLAQRLGKHRTRYRAWLADNSKTYLTSFEILKHGNAYIELLQEFPCENRQQLEKREGELIRANNCVNKRIEGRTAAEYRQDNQEAIAQYGRQHYQANRDQKLQYQKQHYHANRDQQLQYKAKKIKCDFCNIHFNQSGKSRHIKSTKHREAFKAAWRECFGEEHTGQITEQCY